MYNRFLWNNLCSNFGILWVSILLFLGLNILGLLFLCCSRVFMIKMNLEQDIDNFNVKFMSLQVCWRLVGLLDLFLVFLALMEIGFGCSILVWLLGLFLGFGKNMKSKLLCSYEKIMKSKNNNNNNKIRFKSF